jgi:hypothetical protein
VMVRKHGFHIAKLKFQKLWRRTHCGANLELAKGGHPDSGKLSTRRNLTFTAHAEAW